VLGVTGPVHAGTAVAFCYSGITLGSLGSGILSQLWGTRKKVVGLFLEFGWGKPTQFIPWDAVLRIEPKAFVVKPPPGEQYPPFVDQPGWILIDSHLIGRTILDLDGRTTEVVNDVQLLESKGHVLLVHVDASFSGILRRWGIGRRWIKDEFISWKYVQPLSVEDAAKTDNVSLSVARKQLKELPPEDLADVLEELSGKEQEALFSALEPEKAAEVLVAAEPRAQRQIIADLRKERARGVLTEMSVAQLANLFSVLPHSDVVELLPVLTPEVGERLKSILAAREAQARNLMSAEFLSFAPDARVGDVLAAIRMSKWERHSVSYIYVVGAPERTLVGVVDLRELVLASDGWLVEGVEPLVGGVVGRPGPVGICSPERTPTTSTAMTSPATASRPHALADEIDHRRRGTVPVVGQCKSSGTGTSERPCM